MVNPDQQAILIAREQAKQDMIDENPESYADYIEAMESEND